MFINLFQNSPLFVGFTNFSPCLRLFLLNVYWFYKFCTPLEGWEFKIMGDFYFWFAYLVKEYVTAQEKQGDDLVEKE